VLWSIVRYFPILRLAYSFFYALLYTTVFHESSRIHFLRSIRLNL
jgi:hypothetical protein